MALLDCELPSEPAGSPAGRTRPVALASCFGGDYMQSFGAKLIVTAFVGCLSALVPQSAAADWIKAESPNFVVYSEGSEKALRDYVQELEIFDQLLGRLHGRTRTEPALRKLPVFLLSDEASMQLVAPGIDRDVAGFYQASVHDVFAVAEQPDRQHNRASTGSRVLTGGRVTLDDSVLKHEYVHHFMLDQFPAAYPSWLKEGWAEYFMTADVEDEFVTYGRAYQNRAWWLVNGTWLSLRDLMNRTEIKGDEVAMFYAQSWLLTHYLLSTPAGREQISDFAQRVVGGEDQVTALEGATGRSLDEIEQALRRYMSAGIQYRRRPLADFQQVDVRITQLPPSAEQLLLVDQRVKRTTKDESGELLGQVRRLAARHPEDGFAQIALARAESRFGDLAKAESLLEERLAKTPDDVDALQLLGATMLRKAEAESDPAKAASLRRSARARIGAAFKLDPDRFQTQYLYIQSRMDEPDFPNDNDISVLQDALALAPQVAELRLRLAEVYMHVGRPRDAVATLRPIAFDPHASGEDNAVRELYGKATAAAARQATQSD